MFHAERLMTADELLDIEKAYSLLAQIKMPLPNNPMVATLYERILVEKTPHLMAHIKALQSQLDEANSVLDGLRK